MIECFFDLSVVGYIFLLFQLSGVLFGALSVGVLGILEFIHSAFFVFESNDNLINYLFPPKTLEMKEDLGNVLIFNFWNMWEILRRFFT